MERYLVGKVFASWWCCIIAATLFACALGCGSDDAATCSQKHVDECYAKVDCRKGEVCRLVASEMNALCTCLTALGCDQVWFHSYCDGAPYAIDAGCPLCAE
jgi:hypothetical protein